MKHKKKIFKNMVCAGLFVVLLMGCGKEVSVEGEIPSNAAAVSEVNEVQSMELQNTSADEMKETEDLNENEIPESSYRSLVEGKERQELIDTAVKDYKHYLEQTIDLSQWEPEVHYFEGWEGVPPLFEVDFKDPDNNNEKIFSDAKSVGSDGFATKEARQKLTPQYYIRYSEDKKLMGASVLYPKWEESDVPISMGECKKIVEEFLITKELVKDGKIEFITSKAIASHRAYFVYKNGTEGAIGIGINVYSSKVEDFEYMDNEQAEILATPSNEINAVG